MSESPPTRPVADVAMQLAEAGLSLLPIGCSGDKMPAFRTLPKDGDGKATWAPFQEVIPTPEQIQRMFGGCQEVGIGIGIGIVGGTVSGKLSILDIDNLNLWKPYRAIVDEQAPGLLDRLPIVETPRPGRHVYYRTAEPAQGSTKLAKDADKKTLAEIKGEGGAKRRDAGAHARRRLQRAIDVG